MNKKTFKEKLFPLFCGRLGIFEAGEMLETLWLALKEGKGIVGLPKSIKKAEIIAALEN